MGKRGPQKKPTAIKRLEDNPGKHRLPNEPQIPSDALMPIEGDTFETYWKHFEPICKNCGVLTNADVAAFKILCQLLAEYDATRADMDAWSEDRDCDLYDMLANRMMKLVPIILRYLDRFGLTPTARADLGSLRPPSADSEFEKKRKMKLKREAES